MLSAIKPFFMWGCVTFFGWFSEDYSFGWPIRSEAKSISLQQDASKGWLILRFSLADACLIRQEGVIGALHMPTEEGHLHAQALKSSTERLLNDLATPKAVMPSTARGTKGKCRESFEKLLSRMLPRVEMMAADAAPDEQLSMQLLCEGRMRNLLVHSKDLAHATRRVANRTCFADGFLKKVCLD